MASFDRRPLGEVVDFASGKSIKPGGTGRYPVFGSNGVIGRTDEPIHGDAVVIGRVGAYCGSIALAEGDFWASDNTIVCSPKEQPADLRFLYYVLSVMSLNRFAGGSAQPLLTQKVLKSLEVPWPEAESRHALARLMSAFDDLIKINQRRMEILEEMARLIYREWFVYFRFPGHEDVELVESDLGPIPDGWDVALASSVFEVNPRERVDKTTEQNFITMGDLSESCMVCWPSELKPGNAGARFRNGDTLFARITPCLENGKTGFVACLDDDEVGRGSTEFIVLRGAAVGPEFTYLTAREEDFRQNAINTMTGASGRQRVRNECFDGYSLAVPAQEVEVMFREIARPMFELVFSLARQNTVLTEARDLLLPRLISGELDVSALNLDLEPVA